MNDNLGTKWQWEVSCYYNDTVKHPKRPNTLALQTIHADTHSKDLEVAVGEKRHDIGAVIVRYVGD